MVKSSKRHQEDERRRRKYEEKKRQQQTVELRMVPRTVQGTTSTKKAATASTATKGKQAKETPSVPLQPPDSDDSSLNNTDDSAETPPDADTHSDPSLSELSPSPSPQPLRPLSSHKLKRMLEATGLTEDELEEHRYKLRAVLDIMEYDLATKGVTTGVDIDKYHDKSRLVSRTVHLFINVLDVLMFGRTYREVDFDWDMEDEEVEDEDEDVDEDSPKVERARDLARKKETFYQYNALLNTIPDLKTDIHILSDEDVEVLAAYIQRECGKARNTDSSHLVDRILVYYRAGLDIDSAKMPAAIEKSRRGWTNFYTARALVPLNALDTVTEDWKKWCQLILNKKVHIVAEDWPSVLFDLDLSYHNDDAELLDGCLRGPTYAMAVKSLLTGPISAMKPGGRPEKVPGKPPLAIHYKLAAVTPRMLAYIAVLVRHSFVKGDWAVMDGEFNNHEFYNSILALFDEPLSPWAKDLLDWWNSQVFGNMRPQTDKKLTEGRKTMAQLIRAAVKEGKMKQSDDDRDRSHISKTPFVSLEDRPAEDSAMHVEETEEIEDVAQMEESPPKSPAPEEASSSSGAA
ncbi:hypothetical protein K466DRAFT_591201 [Polyporus arcularius HHB13444]|uniref:Uncharacterized protein n=1 Tax=Polyporus arcularius HHB13444 TaxID=1314778 RepID=A0A5C3NVK5_9APHY|nr:hypothetical protein K466DRAFT_591201 [Polyporus arcularius HHB13444]